MTPPAQNAVFTKIIGHVGHFRWLGPKGLMRDFTNLIRIYKAHPTNVWWTESFSSTLQMTLQPISQDFSHTLPNAIPSQHHFSLCRLAFVLAQLIVAQLHEACSVGAQGLAAQYWNTANQSPPGFPGHATWRLAFTPQLGSPRRSIRHVDEFSTTLIHWRYILIPYAAFARSEMQHYTSWNHYLASINTNFSRKLNLIN